jgi:solute carrier family 25 protein 16
MSSETHKTEFILKSLLAGSLAGCLAKTAVAPLDRVKILFQTTHPNYTKYSQSILGPFHAIKDIYKTSGIRGLFRGHSATILRIIPYAGIKFMAYEQFKHTIMPTPSSETHMKKFLAGSLAGTYKIYIRFLIY